jgi:hypothetical protein
MPQPFTHWKVLPHDKLIAIDSDILTVTGEIPMPLGKFTRRMTVVRLQDSRLVIFSAIALDEAEMHGLENYGTPAFMIVPNDKHRLDTKIWKDRYPAIQVIAPGGARENIEKVVPVDLTHGNFDDPDVTLVTVPGTAERELALEIRRVEGTTLVVNDIIGNIRDASGLGGWILRMMGFAGDKPHVPLPVKFALIKDKAAVARQLRQWAELPRLKRVLVSHGAPIENDPKATLRELAGSLV